METFSYFLTEIITQINGRAIALLNMLFPDWIYFARGSWNLGDFCSEDQK